MDVFSDLTDLLKLAVIPIVALVIGYYFGSAKIGIAMAQQRTAKPKRDKTREAAEEYKRFLDTAKAVEASERSKGV